MAEETRNPGEGDDADAGTFDRAKKYAGEQYEKASGAVRDSYNSVREKVDDVDFDEIVEQVRGYVRSNPGKALLISVGVGFVIGLLLRRGDSDGE